MRTNDTSPEALRLKEIDAEYAKLNAEQQRLENTIEARQAAGIVELLKSEVEYYVTDRGVELYYKDSSPIEELIHTAGKGSYHFEIVISADITITYNDDTVMMVRSTFDRDKSPQQDYDERIHFILSWLKSIGVPQDKIKFDYWVGNIQLQLKNYNRNREELLMQHAHFRGLYSGVPPLNNV